MKNCNKHVSKPLSLPCSTEWMLISSKNSPSGNGCIVVIYTKNWKEFLRMQFKLNYGPVILVVVIIHGY